VCLYTEESQWDTSMASVGGSGQPAEDWWDKTCPSRKQHKIVKGMSILDQRCQDAKAVPAAVARGSPRSLDALKLDPVRVLTLRALRSCSPPPSVPQQVEAHPAPPWEHRLWERVSSPDKDAPEEEVVDPITVAERRRFMNKVSNLHQVTRDSLGRLPDAQDIGVKVRHRQKVPVHQKVKEERSKEAMLHELVSSNEPPPPLLHVSLC